MLLVRVLALSSLSIVLSVSLVSAARAATTYSYVGNDYTFGIAPYTTVMHLSIEITLSNALALGLTNFDAQADIISFSIDDGVTVLTEADGPFPQSEAHFSTDASGEIIGWVVAIADFFSGAPKLVRT